MKISQLSLKLFLISLLVSATFFVSCKDNKETTSETTPQTTQEATLEQKKQALQNVAPTSNNTNASGAVVLNPAHGQPGHRCDIKVGAPLNNTSGSTTTTPINLNNSNSTPAATSGSGGINPPHGQPGHRCDVKVGDPL